jgi:hypothetical protein
VGDTNFVQRTDRIEICFTCTTQAGHTTPSHGGARSDERRHVVRKEGVLDASATNATSVKFRLFGGSYGLNAPVICTATPIYYGWVCNWNTMTVPNGSYTLLCEAFYAVGSTFSSGVSITVHN